MTIKVYTAQYRYKGSNRLDITVKTGNKVFAPEWWLVRNYKEGRINEEEYTKFYYELMRKSYREHPKEWERIFKMDRVVFVCFCPPNKFCHRLLLAHIFTALGAEYMGEI
jgi:hypothetical protein